MRGGGEVALLSYVSCTVRFLLWQKVHLAGFTSSVIKRIIRYSFQLAISRVLSVSFFLLWNLGLFFFFFIFCLLEVNAH